MKASVILALTGTLLAAAAHAAPLTDVIAITAGGDHTCAVTTAGAALCWGRNDHGQLGTGDIAPRAAPTPVFGLSSGIVAIEAGELHTCALTAAGGVKCWGIAGRLGDGTSTERLTPVDVSGIATGASLIAAGGSATCAIVGSTLKCWGSGGFGLMGDGSTDARLVPGDVPGLGPVVDATSGTNHSCAVTSTGAAYCWGLNVSGQLGYQPASGFLYSTVPDHPAGLATGVAAISAGRSHTCALMASGGVKCWGSSPFAFVPTDVTGLGSGVTAIAAGSGHTCALLGDAVKCFSGQFGVSDFAIASGAAAVTAGFAHSCAMMTDQTMRCWGANGYGQLGNGTSGAGTNSSTPTVVGFRAPQDITFNAPGPQPITTSPVTLPASASSGLPVEFTSSTPGVCTASGAAVTLVAMGICTVTARQSGSVDIIPATPVTHTFLVTRGSPRFPSQLANISTRLQVQGGTDVAIGGFIIDGSASKTVVIRARGPSLAASGVTNVLANPRLRLMSGSLPIGSNDDWQSNGFADIIQAIGFAPTDPLESALLVTLAPGAYTAILEGAPGTSGVGIVEVFEIDSDGSFPSNISTRGRVLTGQDVMIGGFVITGSAPRTVVVRGRGPSLAPFGIANPLANPQLQLVRSSDQTQVAFNDDWGDAGNAAALSASGFAPLDASESAILVTLDPGAYTAILSGVAGGTGVGIVEVFAVP